MERNALVGLHDKGIELSLAKVFRNGGYSVDIARTPEEMLDYVKEKFYDRYVMDLNLGSPNSSDVTPAIDVYEIVIERVESGEAKFLGISANMDAVAAAREKGIPAFSGFSEINLEDFLE